MLWSMKVMKGHEYRKTLKWYEIHIYQVRNNQISLLRGGFLKSIGKWQVHRAHAAFICWEQIEKYILMFGFCYLGKPLQNKLININWYFFKWNWHALAKAMVNNSSLCKDRPQSTINWYLVFSNLKRYFSWVDILWLIPF